MHFEGCCLNKFTVLDTYVYFLSLQWSCRHPCKITCAFPDTELISPEVHAGEKGPTYYVNESPSIDRTGEAVQLSDIRHTVSYYLISSVEQIKMF